MGIEWHKKRYRELFEKSLLIHRGYIRSYLIARAAEEEHVLSSMGVTSQDIETMRFEVLEACGKSGIVRLGKKEG